MFKSLLGIVEDTAEIVSVPVKIAADMTRTITKPLADAANETAKAVEELTGNDTDDDS